MPGGKRKLAQLFTSQMKIDGDGTTLKRILSGSVGFATPACTLEGAGGGTCVVSEVTIANLSSCDMLFANAEGLSACLRFDHVLAGDGQASIITRTFSACATGDGLDARTGSGGGVLRYIAFKL